MLQHYDVAVIGADVSQLIAALMLGRAGRRVLVIEHEPISDQILRSPCYHVGDMACIARIHDELGITPPPTRRVGTPAPLQVILPKHRLVVGGGRMAAAQELKRAFPKAGAYIDDVLQLLAQKDREMCHLLHQLPSLPPETWRQRLTLWRAARKLAPVQPGAAPWPSNALGSLLDPEQPWHHSLVGALALLQDAVMQPPAPFAAVHLLAQMMMGSAADAPDRGGLLQLLRLALEQAGIEVCRGAVVRRMVLAGKKALSLELAQKRQDVRAEQYIYGGVSALETLFDPSLAQTTAGADKAQGAPQVVGCRLQRQWRLPTRLLNIALGPVAWHLDGRGKGRGADEGPDEPFLLQRQNMPGGDHTLLTLTIATLQDDIDTGQDVTDEPWAQQVWSRVEPRLRRTLPHLPRGDEAQSGLGRLMALCALRYGLSSQGYFGVTGRSRKTGWRNVAYCGQDVVPGLGLEGEYLAAAGCVALVNERAGWR